ncbi:WD40-repeat-containing domain protein, partial [Chytridium lagenaria]
LPPRQSYPFLPSKNAPIHYPRKATKPENISADERFSSAPLSAATKAILNTPTKPPRVISRAPYKVLDAPELQDDFYLNLVDWSSKNMLGVGLGACVYLWNAGNSKVDKLCDLSQFEHVTSVSFNPSGSHVAIGTSRGHIELWDVVHSKRVRQLTGHTCRVGSLAWNGEQLTSGSRDKNIMHRDLRVANSVVRTLSAHKQEVCGLKWNYQGTHLASGGNDNKLMIWDRALQPAPIHVFSDHVAAVKAIAWSPYKPHVLASGGGTADRRIRFWNVTNGTCLASIDTHSQVCNLAWSRNSNEIVSTHGYSQNQVCVWSYTLKPLATLTGHTFRVLYLAMSPDGQSIVTGAGDETLRFWNVFPKMKQKEDFYTSLLSSPFHDNLPTNKTMR